MQGKNVDGGGSGRMKEGGTEFFADFLILYLKDSIINDTICLGRVIRV